MEKFVTSSFQLWESQDEALKKIVDFKKNENNGRVRVSRSTVMREAFEDYLNKNYPQLIVK